MTADFAIGDKYLAAYSRPQIIRRLACRPGRPEHGLVSAGWR